MKRLAVILAVFGLFLAACAPAGPAIVEVTQVPPTSTAVPTPTNIPPEPTQIPVDIPPAARAAIEALMAQLNLTADQIKEVLLHTAVYAGVPAANAAYAIAQRVLAE